MIYKEQLLGELLEYASRKIDQNLLRFMRKKELLQLSRKLHENSDKFIIGTRYRVIKHCGKIEIHTLKRAEINELKNIKHNGDL